MGHSSQIAKWNEEHRNEVLNNAYMELGDTYSLDIKNPFETYFEKEKVPDDIVNLCMSDDYLHFTTKYIMGLQLFPYQLSILRTLWTHRLPILLASRGGAKTMMLGVYATLRALLNPGSRIVVAGAGLRQSGLVFEKMEQIWENAPVLRDINGGSENRPKRTILGYEWKIGQSIIIGVPIGTGSKIRGLRANVILCDEFSAINPEIFETVIRGFAAVQSQDTFEKVQSAYQEELLRNSGLYDEIKQLMSDNIDQTFGLKGNQIVLSGTCSYQFNHFFKYYENYRDIILNQGNLPGGKIQNWKEYAIIKIPYDQLPRGLMDETILEQGHSVMDNVIFQMEYGSVFPKDSSGFYPASIINSATCPIKYGENEIRFCAELYGESNAQYTMGCDPASERDNLTISICKLCDGYRSHVYSWSANRRRFEEDKKKHPAYYEGIKDYNTFIIRKIHELFGRFNIVRLHLDSGGGGRSIIEGLKDPTKVKDGEDLLFDMEDIEVAGEKGLHVIMLCQFTKRDWYESAHYNLLKDMTAKNYIFPAYDSVGIERFRLDQEFDSLGNLMYDTVEGINMEIEQTKYQTALIEEQSTAKGLKKWDLPKLTGVITGDIQAKLRKDHFTSLLLCNDAARGYLNDDTTTESTIGYAAHDLVTRTMVAGGNLYKGRGMGVMKKASGNIFQGIYVDNKDSGGTVSF